MIRLDPRTHVADVAAADGAPRRLGWEPAWGPAVVVAMYMMAVVEKAARAAAGVVDTSAIAQAVPAAEGIDLVELEIAEEPYTTLLDTEESQACQVVEVEVYQPAGPLALVAVLLVERTAVAAALVALVGSKADNQREGASSQSC